MKKILDIKKAWIFTLTLVMLFTLSIPLIAREVPKSLEEIETKVSLMSSATENFLKDYREMTFDNQEEEIATIQALFAEHFGHVFEKLDSIHRNDDIKDVGPNWAYVSFWVSDYTRQWINTNPNWAVPTTMLHSRLVNGVLMEGTLNLRDRLSFESGLGWVHVGTYSGWIHTSGWTR